MIESYCHLATNPGKGGVSVIILWGDPQKLGMVCSMLGKSMLEIGGLVYGWLHDNQGNILDEVLLSCPKKGILLLSGHGGTENSLSLLQFLVDSGFNEASTAPGICSYHDVVDTFIAAARTEGQLAVLLSLREKLAAKEFTGGFVVRRAAEIIRPRRICLVGAPNTGKSSLLNRLCGGERVLVSPHAGTTLDAVEHWLDIGGYDCALVDTAGFRDEAGLTEQEAMRRGAEEISGCDLVLLLVDSSRGWSMADQKAADAVENKSIIVVFNKSDLPADSAALPRTVAPDEPHLAISCSDGRGVDALLDLLVQKMGGNMSQITGAIFTGASLTGGGGCL